MTTIAETQPVIKPDSDGFQPVVNRKKMRAFFKNMLTIKQINEEFDRKEREIMEEMEVSGMNFEFRNRKIYSNNFEFTITIKICTLLS